MLPNVNELTRNVAENSKLMSELLVQMRLLNENVVLLTKAIAEQKKSGTNSTGPR